MFVDVTMKISSLGYRNAYFSSERHPYTRNLNSYSTNTVLLQWQWRLLRMGFANMVDWNWYVAQSAFKNM